MVKVWSAPWFTLTAPLGVMVPPLPVTLAVMVWLMSGTVIGTLIVAVPPPLSMTVSVAV